MAKSKIATKKDEFDYKNKNYLKFVEKLDRLSNQLVTKEAHQSRDYAQKVGTVKNIIATDVQKKKDKKYKDIAKNEQSKREESKKSGDTYKSRIKHEDKTKKEISKMTKEEYTGEKLNPVQKFLRYGFSEPKTIGESKQSYNVRAKLDSKKLKTTQGKISHNFRENMMAATFGEQAKALKPTGNAVVDTATNIVGTIAGYIAPVGGVGNSINKISQKLADKAIAKGATTNTANKILQSLSPRAAKIVAPLLSTVSEGVLTSIPATVLQQQAQDLNVEETLKTGLIDALFGIGFIGAGKGLKAGKNAIGNKIDDGLRGMDEATGMSEVEGIDSNLKTAKLNKSKLKQADYRNVEPEILGVKDEIRRVERTPEITKQPKKMVNKWTGRKGVPTKRQVSELPEYMSNKKSGTIADKKIEYEKKYGINQNYKKTQIDDSINTKTTKGTTGKIKTAQKEPIQKVENIKEIERPVENIKEIERPKVIKRKTDIPEEVIRDPKKFDSYYKLDKNLDKDSRKMTVDKLTYDIGKRIKEKTGIDKIEDLVKHYQKKYNLPGNIQVKRSLRSESRYAKIIIPKEGLKADTNIKISVNPNKPIENQIGALRHELEHLKDYSEGFISNEPKYARGETLRKTYGGKGSHKNYDFFEPDYLRQALEKDLDKGVLETPTKQVDTPKQTEIKTSSVDKNIIDNSSIKTIERDIPKTTKNNPKKVSRHEQTVLKSDKTNESFRKYLSEKRPTEYETTVNQQDWDNARKRLRENNPDKILEAQKNKKSLNADDSHDLMALHDYYTKKGDLDKANEALMELTLKGSSTGQFVQAMSVWNRQSTEGVLKMASKNAMKNIDNTVNKSLLKTKDKLSNDIKQLRDVIRDLEAQGQTKKTKNEIELNLKILSGKEKTLKNVEDKISNAYKENMLSVSDNKYISEHFNNFKSEDFYNNKYQEKLKKLQGNKDVPSSNNIKKATMYAERQKHLEYTRAMQRVTDLEGSTGRERFRTLQRVSLLSNPATSIRNIVSNNLFAMYDIAVRENTIAPVLDYITSAGRTKSLIKPITQKAQSGRTTVFAPIRKNLAYGKGFIKGSTDIVKDLADSLKYKEWIDTNPTKAQFELANKTTFSSLGKKGVSKKLNQVANFADQIVRRMITDRPFYQAAYNARLKELQIIHKTKNPTVDMKNMAKMYGLDKVFQNNSKIAQKMGEIRRVSPVMDLIMPFTQTPGNLMDKLVDYSPGGMIKAVTQFGKNNRGSFDQKLFVDRVSRSLSGVGIAAFGWHMAKKGILIGSLSSSEKEREFQKAKGEQYYSIKLGDKYYSFDWLSPAGNILSVMADIYNETKNSPEGRSKIETALKTGMDTVLSQSMLQGVLRMFSGYSPAAGIMTSLAESSTQAEPTLMKKIAQDMDKYERETKTDSVFKTTGNKLLSGIPKQREKLGVKRDIFGQPIKTKDTVDLFFTPSRVSEESKDKTVKEIDKLYKKTKENKVLPMTAQKEISYQPKFKNFGRTIKGEKIVYEIKTSQDKSEYQKYLGQEQKKAVDSVVRDEYYKDMSDEEKVKAIRGSYEEAKEIAVKKFLTKKKLLK